MFAWLVRASLASLVVAAMVAGWNAGASVSRDVRGAAFRSAGGAAPYAVALAGRALSAKVDAALIVANAARQSRIDAGASRDLVLERVEFERSAGAVIARGSLSDLSGSRPLHVVVDAFDANRAYVASASSGVETTAGSTPFSVSMPDRDAFATFSVRFLDAGMQEVETRSADARPGDVPPLLADDLLHAADLSEVAARLASLGYARGRPPVGDDVTLSVVDRFRRDHRVAGPRAVTVGDLLALRTVSPAVRATADLAEY